MGHERWLQSHGKRHLKMTALLLCVGNTVTAWESLCDRHKCQWKCCGNSGIVIFHSTLNPQVETGLDTNRCPPKFYVWAPQISKFVHRLMLKDSKNLNLDPLLKMLVELWLSVALVSFGKTLIHIWDKKTKCRSVHNA